MVTYNEVFSSRLNKYLTAQKANEMFIGKSEFGKVIPKELLSNNEFHCASNCELQLTCINIGIDFTDETNHANRIAPYFSNRSKQQNHSNHCRRVIDRTEKRKHEKKQTAYYTQEGNTFIMSFEKGKGFPPNKEATQSFESNNSNVKNVSLKNKDTKANLTSKKRVPHISSIKRMIDFFEEYQMNDPSISLLDKTHSPITFEDIFIPIGGQLIDNIYSIYYGDAIVKWVNFNGQKVLRLSFIHSTVINANDTSYQPYTLLFESDFRNNKKITLYKELVKYANKAETYSDLNNYKFMLYYVGTFEKNSRDLRFDFNKNNMPKSLFLS